MINLFSQVLIGSCEDCSLTEKWLVAPSLRIGHQWVDVAAQAGGLVLNIRLKTLKALAIEIAEQDGTTPINLLSPIRGVMLVSRLLRDEGASEGYLGSFGLRPELAETVYRTIQDLRLAGVTPVTVVPDRYETQGKMREIVRIPAGIRNGICSSAARSRCTTRRSPRRPCKKAGW